MKTLYSLIIKKISYQEKKKLFIATTNIINDSHNFGGRFTHTTKWVRSVHII